MKYIIILIFLIIITLNFIRANEENEEEDPGCPYG